VINARQAARELFDELYSKKAQNLPLVESPNFAKANEGYAYGTTALAPKTIARDSWLGWQIHNLGVRMVSRATRKSGRDDIEN